MAECYPARERAGCQRQQANAAGEIVGVALAGSRSGRLQVREIGTGEGFQVLQTRQLGRGWALARRSPGR
jgi:hypothetical protein